MTIGILGNGQLGQMLKMASPRVGVNVALYDLNQFNAQSLYTFLQNVSIVTFETENVSADILSLVERSGVLAHPSVDAIRFCQHRLKEKKLLRSIGIATADFCEVTDETSLNTAMDTLGLPL